MSLGDAKRSKLLPLKIRVTPGAVFTDHTIALSAIEVQKKQSYLTLIAACPSWHRHLVFPFRET